MQQWTSSMPPDILLTNYVMLELLMTRQDDLDRTVMQAAKGLKYLVLDELHTYRGRQGADVAMLVRRVRERLNPNVLSIGTSATMAREGTLQVRNEAVAAVASKLFGTGVKPENIVTETLQRQTPHAEMPAGAEFIHRTHPLVGQLADFIAEQAMSGEDTDLVARAGAIYTRAVNTKTTVYLLRLRSRLTIRRARQSREMLAEEALMLAVEGRGRPRLLPKAEAMPLMQAGVSKNMALDRRNRELETAPQGLAALQEDFERLAESRSR